MGWITPQYRPRETIRGWTTISESPSVSDRGWAGGRGVAGPSEDKMFPSVSTYSVCGTARMSRERRGVLGVRWAHRQARDADGQVPRINLTVMRRRGRASWRSADGWAPRGIALLRPGGLWKNYPVRVRLSGPHKQTRLRHDGRTEERRSAGDVLPDPPLPGPHRAPNGR